MSILALDQIEVGPRFRKDMGDIDTLARSIEAIGLLQPIAITTDQKLIDGGRRLEALRTLGWPDAPVRIVDLNSIVRGEHDANELHKAFTVSERVAIAEAVRVEVGDRQGQRTELLQNFAEVKGAITRDIAAERAGFGNGETYRQAKTVVERGAPELRDAMDAGAVSISAAAIVAKLPEEDQQSIVEAGPEAVREAAKTIREGGIVNRTSFTGNNQWFTPIEYIELARRVLGDFDLDPASHADAQQNVNAIKFFTEESDGLKHDWRGRIWLNPPYAQPEIGLFVEKLVAEFASARVESAIMLTHNYTDTAWFQKAARAAHAICFTRGRVRFVSPSGELASPTQGQAFFYFGADVQTFRSHFADVGFVVEVLQ